MSDKTVDEVMDFVERIISGRKYPSKELRAKLRTALESLAAAPVALEGELSELDTEFLNNADVKLSWLIRQTVAHWTESEYEKGTARAVHAIELDKAQSEFMQFLRDHVIAAPSTPVPGAAMTETWQCHRCKATSGEACNAIGCFANEASGSVPGAVVLPTAKLLELASVNGLIRLSDMMKAQTQEALHGFAKDVLALAAPAAPTGDGAGINYAVLYDYAQKQNVSYNQLCAAVHKAVAAPAGDGAKPLRWLTKAEVEIALGYVNASQIALHNARLVQEAAYRVNALPLPGAAGDGTAKGGA